MSGPSHRVHRARRSLGQNFLVDANIQRKIVDALAPGPDDEILEIGPGQGALTRHLAGTCRRLVLVELDRDLAADLRARYAGRTDVEVVEADFLDVDPASIVRDPEAVRVVGNIPYNVTTPIVFRLLQRPRPADVLLMVQREVALRMAAAPDSSEYGALSVGVQTVARVERVMKVPRNAFRPVPGVESAVVRITPLRPAPLTPEQEGAVRDLTRVAFGWRRKQFQRILRDHPRYGLAAEAVARLETDLEVDLRRRPETFSPADFVELSRRLPGGDLHATHESTP